VDNLGDIGVCWRLARQLATEFGVSVRLWVDGMPAWERLHAAGAGFLTDPPNLSVLPWSGAILDTTPADVVIEAFGCDLPESYLSIMAHQIEAPLWINLEYLSAEAWVEGCHGLPSPHPGLGLDKFFYFPGFTRRTGGLLREHGLLAQRDAFCSKPAGIEDWWRGLGGRGPWFGVMNVSLFSYEVPELGAWLSGLASGGRQVRLLVPEGRSVAGVAEWFGTADAGVGAVLERGALSCWLLPFLSQPDYDRLLWACDLNIVRGEDSFVRAQWAARPFLWHIYPQQAAVHEAKLAAFLERISASCGASPATEALANWWQAWNRGTPLEGFAAVLAHHDELSQCCARWCDALASQTDLAGQLVQFCEGKLKY
jgi:uncharacterized repeat protein (TIGR03837 family)